VLSRLCPLRFMTGLSKLLNRFDFLNAQWDPRVGICLAVIWVIILFCAVSSIRAQGFGPAQQRFWTAVVIFVPILGVLAYLPFSIKRDDLPHYFRFKPKDRAPGSSGSRSSTRSNVHR
jgi:hypothetical protein